MSATTTAVVVATTSANAAANAAASARADQACRQYIAAFDNTTATQQEQFQFADCVNRFRPVEHMSAEIKVMIILAFVFVIAGGILGGIKGREDMGLALSGAFAGVCLGGFAALLCALAIVGLQVLLS